MPKNTFTSVYYLFLASLCIFLPVSCIHTPEIVGKWQEIGKTATLEFHGDSTFNAVDDMGMAVNGKYTLDKDRNIRFEINHKDSTPEIINGTLSVHGDELTYTTEDFKEVYIYNRAKR
jgi:hypothetical protein